jgi:SAM-dependent methyltransferase
MTAQIDVEAFRAFERAGWESAGKAAGNDSAWGPITTRAVEPLLDAAGVKAGGRVLDLACGPGYVAVAASRRGAQAIGVDIAESMVGLARRLHPEIDYRQSEAERLAFADGSFDAVVANFLINHLGAPERAAAEACRVLKPGGRAAFTVWDTPDQARFMGVLLDAVAAAGAPPPSQLPPGPPILRFSDPGEFRGLLAEAGFTRAGVRSLHFQQRFASADELWSCLVVASVRLGAPVLGQPLLVQHRIRQEFERNLEPYAHAKGLELPVSIRLAVGVKA